MKEPALPGVVAGNAGFIMHSSHRKPTGMVIGQILLLPLILTCVIWSGSVGAACRGGFRTRPYVVHVPVHTATPGDAANRKGTSRIKPCIVCFGFDIRTCFKKTSAMKLSRSLPTDSMIVTSTPGIPRDQPGQRRDACQIVSTAGAVAWQPHSKQPNTRMMSDQGTLFST